MAEENTTQFTTDDKEFLSDKQLHEALSAAEAVNAEQDRPITFTPDATDDDKPSSEERSLKKYSVFIALIVLVIVWDVACVGLRATGKISGVQCMIGTAPTVLLALISSVFVRKN